MSLSTGTRLGPYEILAPLGHGGMGEVYSARHLKLEREVAIKVLPDEVASNRERHARFEREARLASSLNHPNIITIYDIAEQGATSYIAMEFVEGRTLRTIMGTEVIPIERAIGIAEQMADGLAKAHAAGIVHRDLKPENVMLTSDGVVKILDFGLAKEVVAAVPLDSEASTNLNPSIDGHVIGTPRYMSPEQIAGKVLDHRSDQFAFGIVLYEMLAGRPPFEGRSSLTLMTAIYHDPAPPLAPLRPDVSRDLERLVRRCLEKDPDARFTSTADLALALRAVRERRERPSYPALTRRTIAVAAASVLAASGVGLWFWFQGAEHRWAAHEAISQISALIEKGSAFEAYRLAFRAKRARPDEPEFDRLLGRISLPAKFVTDPLGAVVSMKAFDDPEAPWEPLGDTPLVTRIPHAMMRIQIRKEGYETFEGAPFGAAPMAMFERGVKLDPEGSWPPGMVRVFAHTIDTLLPQNLRLPGDAGELALDAYFIDRTEVTNRAFQRFVDAGGYRNRSFWVDAFPENGSYLDWERLVQSLKDETGRSAPAGWALGTYPEGGGDLPVGGISWYEAAAYCRFAGKNLPTIYHWSGAVEQGQFSDLLRFSNYASAGPAPVGKYPGITGYGALDMAGNASEWCFNATSDGRRHLLGGSWKDLPYVFMEPVARLPLDRASSYGFRCVALEAPPPPMLFETIARHETKRKPRLPDEVFEALRNMYVYDRSPLNASIEKTDESAPHWRKEIVSLDAAYDDRVIAILFLPRNAPPPYQTVIWVPGSDAFASAGSNLFSPHPDGGLAGSHLFEFIPQSGRALVYLVYDGIYQRSNRATAKNLAPFRRPDGSLGASPTPHLDRDRVIRWSKDFGRTVDYLATRRDIDSTRLAYYGLSSTATLGPLFVTLDGRIRTQMLLGGGLMGKAPHDETAPVHFVDRCTVPTLLINGSDDFLMPPEGQKQLYERLATPKDDKRHAVLEGGHIPSNRHEIIREVLDWLDKYLGPVETTSAVAAR